MEGPEHPPGIDNSGQCHLTAGLQNYVWRHSLSGVGGQACFSKKKKSPVPDEIRVYQRVLRECKEVLSGPLVSIFRKSVP